MRKDQEVGGPGGSYETRTMTFVVVVFATILPFPPLTFLTPVPGRDSNLTWQRHPETTTTPRQTTRAIGEETTTRIGNTTMTKGK